MLSVKYSWVANTSAGVVKPLRTNNNLFLLIPWAFKALNSLMAGNKSSRLAPVGWMTKLAWRAISKVPWLVLAGASIIIKS